MPRIRAAAAAMALLVTACGDPSSQTSGSPNTTQVVTTVTSAATTSTTSTAAAGSLSTTTVAATTSSTTGPVLDLAGVRWVTHGIDGRISGDDGRLIWATRPLPAGVASDRQGGLVFTDSEGLWWFRAGSVAPELVRPDVVDLISVVPSDSGPVAVTSVSEGTRLSDGAVVALAEPADPYRRVAPNGLTAWVTEPVYELDAEGVPAAVETAARLVIQRGPDELVLDVQLGGVYETWPVLHDFDGATVIVSRGPLEPAAGLETFFVVDIACRDCLRVFEATATRAALVAGDADWNGFVEPPEFVRGSAIATDEGVTSLPDGRYLGYLSASAGERSVGFDLAVWFSGNEANIAATVDGSTDVPVPNDYYIRNVDDRVIALDIAPAPVVASVWFDYESDGDLEADEISFEDLLDALREPPEGVRGHLATSPWWVTVDLGVVVAMDEQYVP